jgi:hypothetical protein
MLAVILWVELGWRAAVMELLVEALLGALITGGGGGRRIRRAFRELAVRPVRRPRAASI